MKKLAPILLILILTAISLCGCSDDSHGLSAKDPTTITIWHYYNGHNAEQFDALVTEFNNTVGRENGIIVMSQSMSCANNLEEALWDSVSEKIGSSKLPNIFHCYPDTAIALENKVALVDFDDYVTEDEKLMYVRHFLDAERIGTDRSWKIFPVAEATEILMLNKTAWDKFARDTGADINDLSTWEGIAQTAEQYYEWSNGKAFFGRDGFANYPIVGSSQLGHELFKVSGNQVTLDFDKDSMKKVWDNFYVPYVKGYYSHVGNFRSDDVRIGEIIAFVCSSSAAAYFPSQAILHDGMTHSVECMVLPLPNFKDTAPYAALQEAGMAVTKSTEAEVYASIMFLKWFTESEQNLRFCADCGYMPVSLEAAKADVVSSVSSDTVVNDAIITSLKQMEKYVMYTPTGFANGTQAKEVLERTMPALAIADRAELEAGAGLDEYLTDQHFQSWYSDTFSELIQYCK